MIVELQRYVKLNLPQVNKWTVKYETHLPTVTAFGILAKRTENRQNRAVRVQLGLKRLLRNNSNAATEEFVTLE